MPEFSEEKFNRVKAEAEAFYKTIGEAYCPYFKEKIAFNAKGLEHIKFHKKNVARTRESQYVRFKLLKFAPQIIGLSRTIQGISKEINFESVWSNARLETVSKPVIYYEFIAILENIRIRLIVKQIEYGVKYFWSIVPYWKLDKTHGGRRMHVGNPEID